MLPIVTKPIDPSAKPRRATLRSSPRPRARACAAAALLLSGLVAAPSFAAGVAVDQASETELEAARGPYLEAKKAFDAGNYAAAVEGFQASYDVVASPNSHLMLAKSLDKLGRVAASYRAAKAVVPEAEAAAAQDDKYARTAEDARALMESLRGRVGYLTVRLPPGKSGTVAVDGREIAAEELAEPVLVDPGTVSVSFASPSGADERSITLGPGGTGLVDFGVRDPSAPPPAVDVDQGEGFQIHAPRAVGIGLAATGVAGMVVFGVFGAMTSSKFSELEDTCTPERICPPEAQGTLDDGKTFQTVANVGLVVGITGLIAGTTLFLLEPEIVSDDEQSASVKLTIGPAALGVKGTF